MYGSQRIVPYSTTEDTNDLYASLRVLEIPLFKIHIAKCNEAVIGTIFVSQ